jgi:hypothetical protein
MEMVGASSPTSIPDFFLFTELCVASFSGGCKKPLTLDVVA